MLSSVIVFIILPAVLASGVLVARSNQENNCADHIVSAEEKQELCEANTGLANVTL